MTDRRYGLRRWKRLVASVVGPPGHPVWQCWAPDCYRMGNVADHVRPVYEGMPDAEFFDPANLRPSCSRHNLQKGHAEAFLRETSGAPTPKPTRPTIFAKPNRPRIY